MMQVTFVERIEIINSILDRINEGEKLTSELKVLLTEMSK